MNFLCLLEDVNLFDRLLEKLDNKAVAASDVPAVQIHKRNRPHRHPKYEGKLKLKTPTHAVPSNDKQTSAHEKPTKISYFGIKYIPSHMAAVLLYFVGIFCLFVCLFFVKCPYFGDTVQPVYNDRLYNKILSPVIFSVMRFNEDWRYQFTLAHNVCLLELI